MLRVDQTLLQQVLLVVSQTPTRVTMVVFS